MKTKLALLLTMSALAAASFLLVNATPCQAAGFSMPAPIEHCAMRFCGRYCHHHEHYWYCGEREFYCPGYCD